MISIYSLWKSGALDLPIKLGIIRTAVIEWCKIYDEYVRIRGAGHNYTNAIELTAEKLSVSDHLVKKAIAQVI